MLTMVYLARVYECLVKVETCTVQGSQSKTVDDEEVYYTMAMIYGQMLR